MKSRTFYAKDYAAALMFKAALQGVMERRVHPTMGVLYVVYYYQTDEI